MRYPIWIKAIALVLTACCLLVTAVCGFGIVMFSQLGLYNGDYEQIMENEYSQLAERMADHIAYSYAARTFSDMPKDLLETLDYTNNMLVLSSRFDLAPEVWSYAVYEIGTGKTLETTILTTLEQSYRFVVNSEYAVEVPAANEISHYWVTDENGNDLHLRNVDGPLLEVQIQLNPKGIHEFSGLPLVYWEWAFVHRYIAIIALVAAIVLGGVCVVYLCCAAGRGKKGEELRPGGLNQLPLDIYLAVVGFLGFLTAWVIIEGFEPFYITEDHFFNPGIVTMTAVLLLGWALLFTGWCYALVAQLKMKHFYWWHHCAVGWILGHIWSGFCKVCKFFYRGIVQLIGLLPLVAKRILIIVGFIFAAIIMLLFFSGGVTFLGILLLFALIFWGLALIAYDTYSFGTVIRGAKRMAEGDLTTKIPTKYLLGSYKEHAQRLNAMADVATVAAKKQMKSERMKAELITNVSHDIKTPLTSIINYVDLLKKPHTEEEGAQYLEVLDRQSSRMKKLLEDLMEMSKASTGNMAVEIDHVDAVETVNQALGEFADKLTFAQLTPLFRSPEGPVYIQADGRLTWRVLSNILSNVVKYAMPGTRVYLDLIRQEALVYLSIKNISREELNITADELTERFVRGDASRNTEGNGLGLNIAKSLMELQMGELELTVDGDLFKVTLTFLSGDAG